ncbi:MAG: serine hydrolase domain-containing protein [Bacteroidota bacterium]
MIRTIIIFSIGLLYCHSTYSQTISDSLKQELSSLIEASAIPGLGVSIVGEKGVLFCEGFGLRDRQQNLAYDAESVQSVASISKTIIAIALMKLVEQGKLDLQQNINTYLPFEVINPHFPNTPIRILHLATHSSSIQETNVADNKAYLILDREADKSIFPRGHYRFYKRYLKNDHQALGAYLQSFLAAEGENYKKKNFGKYQPGTQYSYTNVGASLAAYLIEIVSGQSFETFTQEQIFDPLAMSHTQWRKSDSPNLSKQYFLNGMAAPAYTLLTWPSGALHTSSEDMGKFLFEILKGYQGQGKLLSPKSYQYMLENHLDLTLSNKQNGIFWEIDPDGNIGYGGAEIGTACQLIYSPSLNKGFFMMINMTVYDVPQLEGDFVSILQCLSKYAKKLD